MEEIKVGEYIRTKDGVIAKVTDILDEYSLDTDNDVFSLEEDRTENFWLNNSSKMMEIPWEYIEMYVKKHSFNIIDLIENGDYVELEYYVAKYGKRISRVFEISKIEGWNFIAFENAHCNFTYDLELNKWINGKGYNPKIKSIVTKEQMKAMEYEVK